jgi:hypothetical protein
MDVEGQALARIDELNNDISAIRQKIQDIRDAISPFCKHKYTRNYRWEHDNGYGRQKWMTGLECLLCGKRNSWPGMSQLWG